MTVDIKCQESDSILDFGNILDMNEENTVFKIWHKSQMKYTNEFASRKPKLSRNTSYMSLDSVYYIFSNIWSDVEGPPNVKLQNLPLFWTSKLKLTTTFAYSMEISETLYGPSPPNPLAFPSTLYSVHATILNQKLESHPTPSHPT